VPGFFAAVGTGLPAWAPPPAREAEAHRGDDDVAVCFGEVGRAVEQDLLQRGDVEAVQVDDQGRGFLGVVGRRDEQRIRHVGIGFGQLVVAFEDALLAVGQLGLGRARNALEAFRDVGRGDVLQG
jgi:hypothetical protein